MKGTANSEGGDCQGTTVPCCTKTRCVNAEPDSISGTVADGSA